MGELMKLKNMEAGNINQEKSRDYLFDNMRAIMIILVVWGHLLTSLISEYDSIKIIYYFIFFFHMPALTFISGYFAKNIEKARNTAFETILMPYLILNVCNYLFKMLVLKEEYFGFRFFRPLWGLWYLFALFLWKFFLKDLVRIRFILPLSFLLGIFSGFTKEFSTYMALGRVICFLPFFLLGYYCTKDNIERIRRIPKLIPILVILGVGALSTFVVKKNLFKVEVLYLRKPYPEDADLEHMAYRILVYIVAILMIASFIILLSNKNSILSGIGTNTMTVYIFHLFTIPLLEKLRIFYDRPYLYLVYSVIMTVIITFIFSRPIINKLYNKVLNSLIGLFVLKEKE